MDEQDEYRSRDRAEDDVDAFAEGSTSAAGGEEAAGPDAEYDTKLGPATGIAGAGGMGTSSDLGATAGTTGGGTTGVDSVTGTGGKGGAGILGTTSALDPGAGTTSGPTAGTTGGAGGTAASPDAASDRATGY